MTWPEAGDTIAAIATPPGEAGIGIVRLSGPEAEPIARRLFRPRRPRPAWQSHRLYLGHLVDPQGRVLDEVLLTLMRAPHTYTREDVVEITATRAMPSSGPFCRQYWPRGRAWLSRGNSP